MAHLRLRDEPFNADHIISISSVLIGNVAATRYVERSSSRG
jgi:hypothetical protein